MNSDTCRCCWTWYVADVPPWFCCDAAQVGRGGRGGPVCQAGGFGFCCGRTARQSCGHGPEGGTLEAKLPTGWKKTGHLGGWLVNTGGTPRLGRGGGGPSSQPPRWVPALPRGPGCSQEVGPCGDMQELGVVKGRSPGPGDMGKKEWKVTWVCGRWGGGVEWPLCPASGGSGGLRGTCPGPRPGWRWGVGAGEPAVLTAGLPLLTLGRRP